MVYSYLNAHFVYQTLGGSHTHTAISGTNYYNYYYFDNYYYYYFYYYYYYCYYYCYFYYYYYTTYTTLLLLFVYHFNSHIVSLIFTYRAYKQGWPMEHSRMILWL